MGTPCAIHVSGDFLVRVVSGHFAYLVMGIDIRGVTF
jgi:hypothetical protein